MSAGDVCVDCFVFRCYILPFTNRRSSFDETPKNVDRWRCTLCRALFQSWIEAKRHCEDAHKVPGQFMCNICSYSDDAIFQISNHINSRDCVKDSDRIPHVMIMFARLVLSWTFRARVQ